MARVSVAHQHLPPRLQPLPRYLFHNKLISMFQLDLQGKCETCLSTAKDAEIIKCFSCEFSFHALCDSTDGNSNPIAKKTHLSLHKQASTKPNFLWKCDRCLTISEENQAATLKEMVSKLVERLGSLENRLSKEIKSQVAEEFVKLTVSQNSEFTKLTETVSNNTASSVAPQGAWADSKKVSDMKSSLMVKPDGEGKPIDVTKVRKLVRENGIPVNKVVATSTGDTFINLPNEKSRDKLLPLLQSAQNTVVPLKSKLPAVSLIGLTVEHTREEVREGIVNQNELIGKLVNEGEELSVVFTKPPSGRQTYHQVTVRVSPKIRSAIKSLGNHIHLSDEFPKVVDNFHVRRCNKCQCFGHYASQCKPEDPTNCGYCGTDHKSDECILKDSAKSRHKCINCEKVGLKPEGHSTFWYDCPAYKIQQEKLKNSISYDYLN